MMSWVCLKAKYFGYEKAITGWMLEDVILTVSSSSSSKAQEAVDHMASFPSSREEISKLGIEPPTSSLRLIVSS